MVVGGEVTAVSAAFVVVVVVVTTEETTPTAGLGLSDTTVKVCSVGGKGGVGVGGNEVIAAEEETEAV